MRMETASRKFWEGPYETEQGHLTDPEVRKMAEGLKTAGYQFELKESPSEYTLRVSGFDGIKHFTKVHPFYIQRDREVLTVGIRDVLRASIINPQDHSYRSVPAKSNH